MLKHKYLNIWLTFIPCVIQYVDINGKALFLLQAKINIKNYLHCVLSVQNNILIFSFSLSF